MSAALRFLAVPPAAGALRCQPITSVCFPLLTCKGATLAFFFCNYFCLTGRWCRFFELLSSPDSRETPSHSKPTSHKVRPVKVPLKGGRHGCQRRHLGHGNPLTFLSGKCCKFQGLALRDTLRDALRDALHDPFAPFFTGCLLGPPVNPPYGIPSSKVEPGKRGDFFDLLDLSCPRSTLLRWLARG